AQGYLLVGYARAWQCPRRRRGKGLQGEGARLELSPPLDGFETTALRGGFIMPFFGGDAMPVDVEVLVRQRLLASPEVQALVGTRIFPVGGRPDEGPEAALPAITYQRVSNRRLTSHEGSLGASLPLVQLSCWAKTWSEA